MIICGRSLSILSRTASDLDNLDRSSGVPTMTCPLSASALPLRPSNGGLVFTTAFAHVIQACDEDIELSFAEVAPFLTAQGKADLKSLIDAASTPAVSVP